MPRKKIKSGRPVAGELCKCGHMTVMVADGMVYNWCTMCYFEFHRMAVRTIQADDYPE